MKYFFTVLFFSLTAGTAHANFLRIPYEGARPLAMGNAYIALADDANAIWYNPAGLAFVHGVHFNVFDFMGAVDSTDTLNRISNAIFQGNYANLINPNQETVRFSILPSFLAPYFGVMVFDNSQAMYNLQNLQLPNADIYAMNDLGIISGVGIPLSDDFSIGASVRVFERTGVDAYVTPQQLIAQLGINNVSNFNSAVNTYIQSLVGSGYGVGLNLGMMLKVPLGKSTTLQFAATAEDVGQTKMYPISGANTPPNIPTTYNFGTAFINTLSRNSDFKISVDYRDAFGSTPLFEQLHIGGEYHWRALSLRAGYYEGYPSFGLGIDAPPQTKINLTTYAVEEGNSLWQTGQRVYLAQVIIGFNPF
jgi:hypothetical protein